MPFGKHAHTERSLTRTRLHRRSSAVAPYQSFHALRHLRIWASTPLCGFCIDLGFLFQQEMRYAQGTANCCELKCRSAKFFYWWRVNVCAVLEEEINHLQRTILTGPLQGGVWAINCCGVGVCMCCKSKLKFLIIT
jgi:hypothetical protein